MKKLLLILLCFVSVATAQRGSIKRFGIFSPVAGIREDIPYITMPEAFTPDNENVLLRYGEVHRAVLRNDELIKEDKPIIYAADGTDPGVTTIVTCMGHGFDNGDTVTISGLDSGSTEGYYDGDYVISGSLTNNFEFTKTFDAAPASYTGAFAVITSATNRAVTPDENPILAYHWFEKSNGSDYLLCFTKAHAYQWDTIEEDWDLVFTCASDCTEWSVVSMNDWIFATNNVDLIQTWDGTGTFDDADTSSGIDTGSAVYLTKAKFLATFENYLLACNVQVGGTLLPQDIYWSDTGDPETFNGTNSGSVTIPGPDPLTASIQLNDFLLLFTGRSIDSMWLVDSTLIFNRRRLHSSMGTYSPGSVIRNINEDVFFIDNHKNIRVIRSVMADIISVSLPIDKTLKLMKDSLLTGIRSDYIWDYDQIWWAIPYGPDATANNKVFCVNNSGSWTKLDFPVSAFGTYENKITYGWDTLPFDHWLEWGWENWRSADVGADYQVDLCADYSGYTYGSHSSSLDSGDDFTGYAVLGTDFSQQKGTQAALYYKRLLKMTLIFRREAGGEADIYLKRDFESTWQDVGSVSLAGDTEILWTELNCDYRARHFWLKISGDNHFRFIGVMFHYVTEGTR